MEFKSQRGIHLEVEGLEDRLLLAGNISYTPLQGTIVIRGTPRADKVVVSYAPDNQIKVKISGGSTRKAMIPQTGATGIVFRGRGGRDRLINRTSLTLNPSTVSGSGQPTAKGGHDESVALSADQLLIFQQTNQIRQSNGLASLGVNALLQQAAQAHADNMARQDRFGDTDTNGHILDGQDVVNRVARTGYLWSALGENVAYNSGYQNPAQKLIDQWWNSAPHRAALLASDFTQIGIGVAVGASGRTYGVLVFARPV